MTTLLTFVNPGPDPKSGHGPASRLAASLLSAMLVTAAMSATAGEPAAPLARSGAAAVSTTEGILVGKFASGMPVYRLPALTVAAKRDSEFAAMRRAKPAGSTRSSGTCVARDRHDVGVRWSMPGEPTHGAAC